MNETKENTAEVVTAKAQAQLKTGSSTYRTILIAACMGMLIGLLLKQ